MQAGRNAHRRWPILVLAAANFPGRTAIEDRVEQVARLFRLHGTQSTVNDAALNQQG
jgi:hypothetical protein